LVIEKEYICYIMDDFPGASFVSNEIREISKMKKVKILSLLPPNRFMLEQERGFISNNIEIFFAPTFKSAPKEIFRLTKRMLYTFFKFPKKFLDDLGIIFHNGKKISTLTIFLRSIYLMKYLDDVKHIHCHFAMDNSTSAMFISDLSSIPFSFTTHALDIFVYPYLLKEKKEKAKFISTISSYNKQFLKKGYEIDSNKIEIVHCGIDIDRFRPDKMNHDDFNILSVARLVEKKGLDYLIDSCYLLKQRGIDFKCILVGGGPLERTLSCKINEFGLKNVVRMDGNLPQSQLDDLFRKADVFILPSIITENGDRDGIPVSLMEAMSMEIPVISTRVSGIPELIENGISGLLVEEKSSEELANAVTRLLDDPRLRAELGENGRKRIINDFNLRKEVSKLHDLIFNERL